MNSTTSAEPISLHEYFAPVAITPSQFVELLGECGVNRVAISLISGRCGSSYLASIVSKCGFGTGREPFNQVPRGLLERVAAPDDFVGFLRHRITAASAEGVLYFQITPGRMLRLMRLVPAACWITAQASVNLIYRRNFVSQTLSFYNAASTGIWHTTTHARKETRTTGDYLPWSLSFIPKLLRIELRGLQLLRREFEIAEPVIVFYEDIVSAGYETTFAFLEHHGAGRDAQNRIPGALADAGNPRKLLRDGFIDQYRGLMEAEPRLNEWIAKRMRMGANPRLTKEILTSRLGPGQPLKISSTAS